MAVKSRIEWTEATWNPVTGCSKVSSGCKNCYAERLAFGCKQWVTRDIATALKVTLHEDLIDYPRLARAAIDLRELDERFVP